MYFTDQNICKGGPAELKFKDSEMRKLNIAMDRAQRAGKINGVICLVIMCTPGVMVLKMSKLALIFLYFLLITAKRQLQLGENI